MNGNKQANIQTHNHDGLNSQRIKAKDIQGIIELIKKYGGGGGGGGIPEAPEDGFQYGRQDATWTRTIEEAPDDGKMYVRKNVGWAELSQNALATFVFLAIVGVTDMMIGYASSNLIMGEEGTLLSISSATDALVMSTSESILIGEEGTLLPITSVTPL